MRLAIRLNRAGWPPFVARWRICLHDPRPLSENPPDLTPDAFSAAVSVLNTTGTFRLTRAGRHPRSNAYVCEVLRGSSPVVLDVGASDGSTSLDLIRELSEFTRYYVTDLELSFRVARANDAVYFARRNGECILRASKRLLVYSDRGVTLTPFAFVASWIVSHSFTITQWQEVCLIQPAVVELAAANPTIRVRQYDMFTPWTGERPDLIKVANVLNPSYFTETQIRRVLAVQCDTLADDGRLLIVDNRDRRDTRDGLEKFSVFRKTSAGMVAEWHHRGGADAARYVPVSVAAAPFSTRGPAI